jgi:alkylated DNA repair dioxygenase AlkB
MQSTEVPGLYYFPNWISSETQKQLLNEINQRQWDDRITIKSQHYGFKYTIAKSFYIGRDTLQPTEPIPDIFTPITQSIRDEMSNITDIPPEVAEIPFGQLMVNSYRVNQGLAPHIDHQKIFGAVIAVVSLQGKTIIQFKKGAHVADVTIEPYSLYIMSGASRYEYTHRVSSTGSVASDTEPETRISLVFRQVTN